jgi:hypothetical protein
MGQANIHTTTLGQPCCSTRGYADRQGGRRNGSPLECHRCISVRTKKISYYDWKTTHLGFADGKFHAHLSFHGSQGPVVDLPDDEKQRDEELYTHYVDLRAKHVTYRSRVLATRAVGASAKRDAHKKAKMVINRALGEDGKVSAQAIAGDAENYDIFNSGPFATMLREKKADLLFNNELFYPLHRTVSGFAQVLSSLTLYRKTRGHNSKYSK